MSTSRPFSFNPFSTGITGTIQIGELAIGDPTDGFDSTGLVWWGGPDEDPGFVIAHPQSDNNQPTPDTSKQAYWDYNHKGTDIVISGQFTYQQFGYQQSVLSDVLIDSTKKVMVSYTIGNNQNSYPVLPAAVFVGFGTYDMNYQGSPYGGYPGNDTYSLGVNALGDLYYGGSVTDSGLPTWGNTGDIVDMAFDGVNQKWWIRVNGGIWNNDILANPETNTNGLPTILSSFRLAVCPAINTEFTINNYSKYYVPNSHPEIYPGSNQFYFLGRKTASVGFWRSEAKTESSFLELANYVGATTFGDSTTATTWLNNNGYWTSFAPLSPVLSLDASTYSGSGGWIDSISNKDFTLYGNPSWSSNFGGLFQFDASSGNYAECSTSLNSLSEYSVELWHQWDGTNTGSLPCIITETYTSSPINYAIGSLTANSPNLQGGFFDGGWRVSPSGYVPTSGAWSHIVLTVDSNKVVCLYIDKVLISITPHFGAQTPTSSNSGIRLMRRWDGAEYWGGALAIVNIFDKTLDQTEVNNQYDLNIGRFS